MDSVPIPGVDAHDVEEVTLVARGIATAVAPDEGLTDVQADLLEAIASALTGVSVDYRALEPLGSEELADALGGRDCILTTAALGFLGLGVRPPAPEWGMMMSEGREFLSQGWWVATMPGFACLYTGLGFILLGDGVADLLRVKGQ